MVRFWKYFDVCAKTVCEWFGYRWESKGGVKDDSKAFLTRALEKEEEIER